ncbi:MAG TPA: hypothetical protein VGM56_25780, partial [Byssovorax sp.]
MTTRSAAREAATNTGAAAAVTALAVAYPALTTWYFWADWFRFLDFGGPMTSTPAGLLIPFGVDGYATVLSPWRIVAAGVTAFLLGRSARKLWRRESDGPALSLLTLWGVLLPQLFWYTEFSADWRSGRGLGTIVLAAFATVVLPTALLVRGKASALGGWGKLAMAKGRLLAATAGLGWTALAAMTFLDHSDAFSNVGGAMMAGLATLPLAALGMVGLWRQRTWGLMAAGGAVAALGAMFFGMGDAAYAASGRAMDWFAAAPALHPGVLALAPMAVLTAILAPFVVGMARTVAGAPLASASASAASYDA